MTKNYTRFLLCANNIRTDDISENFIKILIASTGKLLFVCYVKLFRCSVYFDRSPLKNSPKYGCVRVCARECIHVCTCVRVWGVSVCSVLSMCNNSCKYH